MLKYTLLLILITSELTAAEILTLDAHSASPGSVSNWGPFTSSGNNRPTLIQNAINGHPAVRFNGIDSRMSWDTNALSNSANGDWFFVLQLQQLNAWETIFSLSDNTRHDTYFFVQAYEGLSRVRMRRPNNIPNGHIIGNEQLPLQPILFNLRSINNTVTLRINGIDQQLTNDPWTDLHWATDFDTNTISLGAIDRSFSVGWQDYGEFDLGAVRIFDTALTNAQNRQIEQELAAQWGIPLPEPNSLIMLAFLFFLVRRK